MILRYPDLGLEIYLGQVTHNGTVIMQVRLSFSEPGEHTFEYELWEPEIKTLDETFIPTSVPVIQSAQVGQTIVVKSVDENGKPTEWEAVDGGGSGGGPLRLDVDWDNDTVITPLSDILDAAISGRGVCMIVTLSSSNAIICTLNDVNVRGDNGAFYSATLSVITHNGNNTAILHHYTISEDSSIDYVAYEITATAGR
jgi:hypothetical protein